MDRKRRIFKIQSRQSEGRRIAIYSNRPAALMTLSGSLQCS